MNLVINIHALFTPCAFDDSTCDISSEQKCFHINVLSCYKFDMLAMDLLELIACIVDWSHSISAADKPTIIDIIDVNNIAT